MTKGITVLNADYQPLWLNPEKIEMIYPYDDQQINVIMSGQQITLKKGCISFEELIVEVELRLGGSMRTEEALRSAFDWFDNHYDGAPDSGCSDMVEPLERLRTALKEHSQI